jgi:hypothetical protein
LSNFLAQTKIHLQKQFLQPLIAFLFLFSVTTNKKGPQNRMKNPKKLPVADPHAELLFVALFMSHR